MSPELPNNAAPNTVPPTVAESDQLIALGAALGEASAFGHVAGRSTAARAAAIFRIHEEKLYRHVRLTWEDFCPAYLKISRAEADRILAAWREFGPAYFELSHLTRISPDAFRALAPAIHDGAIHTEAEAVPLTPENSTRVANIVAEFRRGLVLRKVSPTLDPHIRIAHMEQRCTKLVLDFDDLSRRERHGENWILLTRAIARLRASLDRLARENGLK